MEGTTEELVTGPVTRDTGIPNPNTAELQTTPSEEDPEWMAVVTETSKLCISNAIYAQCYIRDRDGTTFYYSLPEDERFTVIPLSPGGVAFAKSAPEEKAHVE